MTNPKWLIAIGTMFVVMSFICGLCEGTYLSGLETGRLQVLMSMPFPPTLEWFGNLWGMMWFDYAFFHGGWVVFKYIFFWPIAFGLIVSFGALILQSTVTALRSLIPWGR